MGRNGKFRCFRCVLHLFRMRYDLYIKFINIPIFVIFDFFWGIFIIWWSKFWHGVLRDEFLAFEMSLETSYLFPKLFCAVTLTISSPPSDFSKKVQKVEFYLWIWWTWSSSGWVLMDYKYLPSKSVDSEDYFSYFTFFHIFKG